MFKIQTKQQKKKEIYPYMNLYIWATFLCLTIVFLYICFNGGNAFAQWVSHDIWDTGNDFFNSIPAVKGFGLGYKLLGQYPPLAKLFFLLMAHIYSYHGIPLDTAIRNSMTDPRMQQAAMVPFILFILFTVFAVIVILDKMFENEKQSVLLGISVIGTYSVLFAIERGNIILLSFMFLMFFIAFYQSENKWLREAALISLALSAGLKFYPAAFGVLLLYERRWKEAARTVVYGLLALFIPYLIGKQYLPENEASSLVNSVAEFAQGLWNGMFGARTLQQQIFIGIAIVVALMGMVLLGPQIRRGGTLDSYFLCRSACTNLRSTVCLSIYLYFFNTITCTVLKGRETNEF